MATIRDKLGHRCLEADHYSVTGVSEWPEMTGLLSVSDGGMVSLRGASSSPYQREGELVFTGRQYHWSRVGM
jgi:hypothetical protein